MIDFSEIESCFTNIVGFNDSQRADIVLTTALKASTSGFKVNDRPGIQLSIIKDSLHADEFSTSVPDFDDLNVYLERVRTEEIRNTIQEFINRHKELTKARTILEDISLTKGINEFSETETKSGRFVGIRLKPKNSKHVALMIRRIGLQATQTQTDLNIYMFISSQNSAIKTTTITTTEAKSLQYTELTDWVAKYRSTYGENQEFYIGYFEDDLSGDSIETQLCDCGGFSRFSSISGFYFDSDDLNGVNLPTDPAELVHCTDETFGMHLWADAQCDITKKICDNKTIFAPAIADKIAVRLLDDVFDTTRINSKTEISHATVERNRQKNIENYDNNLKGIRMDFTDLDNWCMPCVKNTIKMRTLS